MRKVLVFSVALMLAISMLATIGCGGDTGKAKEYMKAGDDLSIKMESFSENATSDVEDLLIDLGVDLAVTGTVEFKKITDEAKKMSDELNQESKKAKVEYGKILDLSGVEEYKEYANLRIKAINNTSSVLESLKGLLGELESSEEEGKEPKQAASDWAKDNKEVLADAAKAIIYWTEADSLKTDKKL